MADLPGDRDPVEVLADEFAARCRRGEPASVLEYAAKHPEYAAQIEALFPAVALMEQLRRDETARREAAVRQSATAAPPDHLGDFEILREIGRGGMGIVYEAEQRSLARRVAVKVLPKYVLLPEQHLKRFQREAQTAARLHHTNIVPVFGVGEQEGLNYYVMPLVRGVGLDELIRELRGRPPCGRDILGIAEALTAAKFPAARSDRGDASGASGEDGQDAAPGMDLVLRANPWRVAAHVGLEAAAALDYAHAQGTLHRAIKPGTLLIDGQGVVCVADFGLARAVDTSGTSRSGEVVGTPRYMAPEQLRGTADVRTDVYALGLTLYELLTLRPALDESDRRSCLEGRHAGWEPVRPRKIDPSIPRDLETIVLKCLAQEPARRYPTAAALAADLRRFLEDKPICARRISAFERGWRWCRRNPALAAMSAVAAMLLVGVAATALTGHLRTRSAYAEAKRALARAEATSHVALEVLENIYLQLSPDRVWIPSDSDLGSQACACIGLRAGGSASAAERALVQVQASPETAALLENLLVFYDRLAEQISNDARVMLESAIASRRVGDIRQRLGQIDRAEAEYRRAVEKLAALVDRPGADVRAYVELARSHNEIGNVRSARFEAGSACQAHRDAMAVLESFRQPALLPETGATAGSSSSASFARADGLSAEFRYELARTCYFLESKQPGAFGGRGVADPDQSGRSPAPPRFQGQAHRKRAIRLLEELARENADAPDYRFLLALCYRPSAVVAEPARGTSREPGRSKALRILEDLKAKYPGLSDYRYELAATYAWVYVGLFPWQGPSVAQPEAEEGLRKALAETQWLVDHNPTIPLYARCKALILAKLATVCRSGRRLAEAEDLFQEALQTQEAVVAQFPDLPSHDRVLLEFVRLRLGEVCDQRGGSGDVDASRRSRELLATCVRNLTELAGRPELAEDRLATTSLHVAQAALGRARAETARNDKSE